MQSCNQLHVHVYLCAHKKYNFMEQNYVVKQRGKLESVIIIFVVIVHMCFILFFSFYFFFYVEMKMLDWAVCMYNLDNFMKYDTK